MLPGQQCPKSLVKLREEIEEGNIETKSRERGEFFSISCNVITGDDDSKFVHTYKSILTVSV